ncbi:MAG: type II secretion system F family protein [Gemmatimonadales bacterium]|jgi:tight adherence protein B|nr:MAG: type II secretion system F family protein [Gemmatimonadales bacterium]
MSGPSPVVLAVVTSISVFVAFLVVFQAFMALRQWRLRRHALDSLNGGDEDTEESELPSLVRRALHEEEGIARVLAERVPQIWDLHHLLVQSGLNWTLQDFAKRAVGFAVVFGVFAAVVSDSPVVLGLAMMLGASLPYFHVRRKKKKRLLKLEAQLPDTIDSLARAARAGHPLSEGLRMAAEEAPEPVASEFRVTVEEQRFGLPFEDSLMGFGDRVEIMDVRILITAILVQKEVGGNLTEILEQIAETMRARFNLRRQVRVYTAQGRMSGYTLAALPILVGLMISLINPAYLRTLFVDPLGQAMLAGAVLLQGIGFLWIRKIVDVRF